MSNPLPEPGSWDIVLRRITEPTQQKALSGKSIGIVVISAALAIGGVALALTRISPAIWLGGWVLAIVGLLATGIWVLIAVNSRVASTWTGDDLIEILVADEGVVVQGGLAVAWDEVSEVQYEWTTTRFTGNLASQAGAGLAGAAFDAAGIDTSLKVIQIRLKDYKAVKARTTSKVQRLVLFGPMLGDPGYLHVGQHGRSVESLRELLAVLADQAERHGVPMNRKVPA